MIDGGFRKCLKSVWVVEFLTLDCFYATKARCKECKAAEHLHWRSENAEKFRANIDRWQAENKDRVIEYQADYAKANRPKKRAWLQQYRATLLSATPGWADEKAILAFHSEAMDLSVETGIEHDVDHIIPLRSPIVCGLHCQQNLQVLVAAENRKKQNLEWPTMSRFEVKESIRYFRDLGLI